MQVTPTPDHLFDRVVIKEGGASRTVSLAEFLELPLSTRIRYVLERSARFYSGPREVDRHGALNALRHARIAK